MQVGKSAANCPGSKPSKTSVALKVRVIFEFRIASRELDECSVKMILEFKEDVIIMATFRNRNGGILMRYYVCQTMDNRLYDICIMFFVSLYCI